ncbi:MAG: protein kinase [Gemmatimonadetes bacterium]|nr:protein kinase [Gemmatimonadota bacterium]
MSDPIPQLNTALEGRYRIERELGEGGMATVYLADDVKHDRKVAIKVLKPDLAASVGAARFLEEIKTTANLQHPHILPLFDSGSTGGFLFYIMPHVEGESLRERLDREQQLPIDDALEITAEVADALSYAHEQGMIHRDIKPGNIMLTRNHAVVTDFGIGRALDVAGRERLTQSGSAIGTPMYMSPEQWDDSAVVDGRADVYALACTLYEMLVGQPPFSGKTRMALMARHTLDQVPAPSIQRATVPPQVESVLIKALQKSPADRYRTASEFAEALTLARRGKEPAMSVPRDGSKRRIGTVALAGATLLAAVLLAVQSSDIGLFDGARSRSSGVVAGTLPTDRIAVRYFQDMTPDSSLAFIADGLTEALIDELSLVPALEVLSRDGSERFRDPSIPHDSVARAVRAGTIVSGSLQRLGDGTQVGVALSDGESGAEFRRATFEIDESDLLRIRTGLVEEVTALLREWLGEEIALRDVRAETSNVAAWALLQRGERARKEGEWQIDEGDVEGFLESFRRADSLLAAAESEDSSWARPPNLRARLAVTWTQLLAGEPLEAKEWIETGTRHVERVLEMDPTDAHALETRGILKYVTWALGLERDPSAANALLVGAEEDLRSAVRRDPQRANAWNVLSIIHSEKPDLIEAKIAARRAYEADAFLRAAEDVLFTLYATSYDLEQFPDAVTYCEEGRRRFASNPLFVECQLWLLASPAVPADVDRAWTLADELVGLTPPQARAFESAKARVLVGGVLASATLSDSADAVLRSARPGPSVDPGQELLGIEAVFRVQMNQPDEAVELLKTYLAASPEHRVGWRLSDHWWWRELRDNEEFQELIGSASP